jgi:uncharacterized protein
MLGLLVIVVVSSLLLFWLERKSILCLGLTPSTRRTIEFVAGFFFMMLLCVAFRFAETTSWRMNDNVTGETLGVIRWNVVSVLTEEFLFRGALLYILIVRLGTQKAILISASAFGIYHWFSFGAFGNIVPMIFIFVATGLMGWAFALAFVKTKSLFLPVGLHLGWNLTFNFVFSKGPSQQGWLVAEAVQNTWLSLIEYWIFPAALILLISYVYRKEKNTDGVYSAENFGNG